MGVFAEVRQLSASVTQRQLEDAVAALCADPRIDGVLVQLPLPRHIDEEASGGDVGTCVWVEQPLQAAAWQQPERQRSCTATPCCGGRRLHAAELCHVITCMRAHVVPSLPPCVRACVLLQAIIESFDPQKDVDGFHPLNMGEEGGAPKGAPAAPWPRIWCLLARTRSTLRGTARAQLPACTALCTPSRPRPCLPAPAGP